MRYQEILDEALKLPLEERLQLIADLLPHPPVDDEPMSAEEITKLMSLVGSEPLNSAEIVKRGLTGGWEDLALPDTLIWLEQHKQNRRNRNQW